MVDKAFIRRVYNETVTLVKHETGEKVEGIWANVQKDHITTWDAKIEILVGDHLIRRLDSGREEIYKVLNPGYQRSPDENLRPPHYQADVELVGMLPRMGASQVNIEVHGNNNIVAGNSIENSANTVSTINFEVFTQLKDAAAQISDEETRSAIIKCIEHMQTASTNGDSKTFSEKYKEFMANAANHMTVFAPLLPMLAQLLS